MIGSLSGRIVYKTTDQIMIEVSGVGYLVSCSERTLAALPGAGEFASIFTDMVVREDLMQLLGFTSLAEKEWHRMLLTVQGVGAKASLAILGALGADGLSRAIALGDWNAVKAAKGIGPKTAQRIVLDLKDKAPAVMSLTPAALSTVAQNTQGSQSDEMAAPSPVAAPSRPELNATAQADALSALGNLGYAPSDAAAAVAQALTDAPELETAELIRVALKALAPQS